MLQQGFSLILRCSYLCLWKDGPNVCISTLCHISEINDNGGAWHLLHVISVWTAVILFERASTLFPRIYFSLKALVDPKSLENFQDVYALPSPSDA